ncbi:MAG: glycosyltransferase [Liquorilactobacillus hordei]|uniref:glycosyltransferase n=1 Tax=Liquorilactobacillus hordei TaxID=468911 RepID=UPI0039EAC6D4
MAKLLDRLHKPYVNRQKCVRLACSQSAGEWMFPHRKFRVIADAIETAAFKYSEKTRQAARHKLSLENRLVIGSVARFGPQKNLLFLVDVFHKICEVEKQAVLMLVGTGVQEPLLRQRVHQYGLGEKVLFLGARHDTASLMQAMDLMIAPSVFEGFGMSVLEAQCAGLPCYVSDAFQDEVRQTPLVKKMPLELGADKWSGQIISDLKLRDLEKRSSYAEVIKENGYDNTEVAAEFQARLLSGFK